MAALSKSWGCILVAIVMHSIFVEPLPLQASIINESRISSNSGSTKLLFENSAADQTTEIYNGGQLKSGISGVLGLRLDEGEYARKKVGSSCVSHGR